jgi:hypothetical protein
MSLFNPFAALTGGLTQGLAQTPFGKLVGMGQPPQAVAGQVPETPAPFVRDTTGLPGPVQQPPAAGTAPEIPVSTDGKFDVRKGEDPELVRFVTQTASKYGIDPTAALKVARSEGGLRSRNQQSLVKKNGVQEPSFGPFQLLVGGGNTGFPEGMGNQFMRETGLDPRDPKNAEAAIDFALGQASKLGWGQWYGAKAAGLDNFAGIGGRPVGGAVAPMTGVAGSPIERVFAAAAGASPSGQGQGQPQGGQTQQRLTPLQRALAATQGGATSPQAHAGVKLGGGEGQQQDVPASDLGADEIAGLSQTLAQRKMAPDERAAQRKQMIKDRQKPKRKTV